MYKLKIKFMKGYVTNIEQDSIANKNFRKVVYTAKSSQLVLMSLKPGEDIGMEVHQLDQFFRVESGRGKAILDGVEHEILDGFAVVVPTGTNHNIVNTGDVELKLYTIYSPPNHKDGTVHETKEIAEANEEHYDGEPTE